MSARPNAWTFAREGARAEPAVTVLVAAPVRQMVALGRSDTEENALLRAVWHTALAELPDLISAHRLSWRSFLFCSAAGEPEVAAGSHRLLERIGGAAPVPWYVVLTSASGDAVGVHVLEARVAALAKRSSPSVVLVVDPS